MNKISEFISKMGKFAKRAFMAWLTVLPVLPFVIYFVYLLMRGTDHEMLAYLAGMILLLPISIVGICVILPLTELVKYILADLPKQYGIEQYVGAVAIILLAYIAIRMIKAYRRIGFSEFRGTIDSYKK